MSFYLHSKLIEYKLYEILEYLNMSLEIGKKVPDFSLVADNGKPYKLSSQIKQQILLVFYPGDGTPVCTNQLTDYRDHHKEFTENKVEIVGISTNSVSSHKNFKKSHDLPFTLLADTDGKVSKEYDCYGWFGTKRAVFLVDKDLTLKYKHIESVSIFRRTANELLEAIKASS